MNALEIKDLSKSFRSNFLYKRIDVLKNVNLTVKKGTIYGFLGPNGAGKTTTIKCILGLINPDGGTIRLSGRETGKASDRYSIGFLPESPYFYDYLTAAETLELSGKLASVRKETIRERSEKIIRLIGLKGKENILLKKFSKGMLQRIGLGQALVNNPDLIILDEPFSGLDPIGRKELRDIILSLKAEGKTIFFSSHILQDMELIVDDIGILINGKITKEGELRELVKDSVKYIDVAVTGMEKESIKKGGFTYSKTDEKLTARVENHEDLNRFLNFIEKNGGKCTSVSQVSYSLEDLFLKEIGK
ncbi:MAG: ABC transporter ATP-binding protein [Acidobacteriota bacterium]